MGKKRKGVVVDMTDPDGVREAMRKAGYGGKNPDKRKRTKPIPWIERVKKMFGGDQGKKK